MAKPEIFSPLYYGNRDVFERRVSEGYTEIAFGGGDWVDDKRIVRLWAFYHPNGQIATYEHPKLMISGGTLRCSPLESLYTPNEFQKHKKDCQIKLGEKINLAEIVEKWEE